ncbi:MAG: 2-amino-4-hydroxy-6-hydroxymethyldihydropteridine diphosphokinase [Terriglobales bacterium]
MVYLSLGSNVGDRDANLRAAIAGLGHVGVVRKISSFYETEPMEFQAQDWFINCVVELETDHSPRELMASILAIEKKMGRHRNQPKGPRNIDIDVVFYQDMIVAERDLKIPHPAMHRRRFVLAPLAEIAPDAIHPVFMRSASDLLAALGDDAGEVRRLPESAK